MNFIKAFFVVAAAYILQSCFNSDDYIFNEAETTNRVTTVHIMIIHINIVVLSCFYLFN